MYLNLRRSGRVLQLVCTAFFYLRLCFIGPFLRLRQTAGLGFARVYYGLTGKTTRARALALNWTAKSLRRERDVACKPLKQKAC